MWSFAVKLFVLSYTSSTLLSSFQFFKRPQRPRFSPILPSATPEASEPSSSASVTPPTQPSLGPPAVREVRGREREQRVRERADWEVEVDGAAFRGEEGCAGGRLLVPGKPVMLMGFESCSCQPVNLIG
ncbi:hypothetical protein L3X38_036914 [Prunus dulcis]|uniref:Uncharacterized protein n=1 Tax=Prunus dulcis TaxID=3755 RepID=A0AAD4V4F8_PRUDU|nr:hypothetical protein L3X38_036914 [Prunus dulcis]